MQRKDYEEENWDSLYEEAHIYHTIKDFEQVVKNEYDWWNLLCVDVQMEIAKTAMKAGIR